MSKNEIRYREKMKPVDGLNVFAMSLGDVLYDPETQRYYVTNTGKQVDMQSINPAAEDEATDDAEADPEERYNHNHGSDGRFTTGSGSSGVDNDHKGGRISVSQKAKGVRITSAEMKHIQSECLTWRTEEMMKAQPFSHRVGKYRYEIMPDGTGTMTIVGKALIRNTKKGR